MGVARPKEGSLLSVQEGSGFESRATSSRREEAMGIPEQVRLTKEHMFPKWTEVQEQVAYITQVSSRFPKFWSR